MKDCLVLSLGRLHPSSRVRLQAYQDPLARWGWRLSYHHFDRGMGRALASNRWQRIQDRFFRLWQTLVVGFRLLRLRPKTPIIVSREMPISPALFERVANPLILDIDDGLYLGPGREHILRLCRRAEVVVCGNWFIEAALAPYARATRVIPTVIDCTRCQPSPAPLPSSPVKLGWVGSSMSIDFTLKPFLPTLKRLREELDFRLVVVVDGEPDYLQNLDWVELKEWNSQLETRLGELFHIGIMPLQQEDFQAAKCGCKLIQYMACGLPSVATDIGVNRSILQGTGRLAESQDQWLEALRELSRQPELRQRLGEKARQVAVKHFSVEAWAPQWLELLNSFVGCGEDTQEGIRGA